MTSIVAPVAAVQRRLGRRGSGAASISAAGCRCRDPGLSSVEDGRIGEVVENDRSMSAQSVGRVGAGSPNASPEGATEVPFRVVGSGGQMSLKECRLVDLPIVHDRRGNLTFIEGTQHVPFDIRRVYYLYDVPGGAARAGHGHRELEQLIVAMSGSFDVTVDDGRDREVFHLNRSYFGLFLPRMVWREVDNFSSGAVCLVLASTHYDESDYYRDYEEFKSAALAGRSGRD